MDDPQGGPMRALRMRHGPPATWIPEGLARKGYRKYPSPSRGGGERGQPMTAARYLTSEEIDQRLVAQAEAQEAQPWPSNKALLIAGLIGGILLTLGIFFAIGLTLHEAYDAQTGMGAHVSPPPFNSFFDSIHNFLATTNGWMWRKS